MRFSRQLIVGSVSGAAGALAMELFQLALRRVSLQGKNWIDKSTDSTHHPQTVGRKHTEKHTGGHKPSTAQVLQKASSKQLSTRELQFGSEVVHYITAMAPAALYVAWRRNKSFSLLYGVAFGLSIFAVLNQALVPALGLSSVKDTHSWQNRKFSSIAHALYGVTTEAVRSVLVRAIGI